MKKRKEKKKPKKEPSHRAQSPHTIVFICIKTFHSRILKPLKWVFNLHLHLISPLLGLKTFLDRNQPQISTFIFFFSFYFYTHLWNLSSCYCAWPERVVLWTVWGGGFSLLSFSQGFHGRWEIPVLLFRLIYLYLLISTLFTAEGSVTSAKFTKLPIRTTEPEIIYHAQQKYQNLHPRFRKS